MFVFTKKLIISIALSLTTASTIGLAAVSYQTYQNNKTESNTQFDFDSNDISDSEISLDGIKDAAYGSAPSLTFGPGFCVDLYTYHGSEALYFYFDVTDTKVIKRAIGDNNAQDEDGVEISIDRLIDGGTTAQLDDLRIYLGVSGYSKVIKGTGSGWDTNTIIGFGGKLVSYLKEGTTINDNSNFDNGYALEYRIPYISIFGDANNKTPLALVFVHSGLDEVSGTRTRTGMSNQSKFKIPSADNPNNYIILAGNESFYTKKEYANLNENLPTVLGRVYNRNHTIIHGARAEGYYVSSPQRKERVDTDENGYFIFENIRVNDDYIVNITKSGFVPYTLVYTKDNLVYANGSEYSQDAILVSNSNATRKVSGDITALSGDSLSGFKVELVGHPDNSVLTDADGHYEIDVYSDVENKILITKNGFERKLISVGDKTTLDEVEMYHAVTNLIKPSYINLSLNKAIVGITKADKGIYVKALSYYPIQNEEYLSICFNTGDESNFYGHYSSGDYIVRLSNENADVLHYNVNTGTFEAENNISEGIALSTSLDLLYQTELYIPYSSIYLSKDDVFGVAATFFDGEQMQESYVDNTVTKDGEIDFESTATYIRFDKNGSAYFSNSNKETNFLYYYHAVDGAVDEAIPTNADRIYMTYVRDDNGLSLDVAVDNGFSTHFNPKYVSGIEAINIIFNLDNINLTAWALAKKGSVCYDMNLRIYSDDTLCFVNSSDLSVQASNQLWWSDRAHNNGVAKNFTLTSTPISSDKYQVEEKLGYKVYHINFTYADLCSYGGAPSETSIIADSPISIGLHEISETSKTTVRFYTSSGDSWVYKNNILFKSSINYSSQGTFVSLDKNGGNN